MPTLAPSAPRASEHLNIVIVGHVDHGKSTLLGRLYADTGSLPDGKLDKVREICRRQGKEFEYAFLFDAFLEEQEQGITIDTARTFFKWEGRHYIIIDAPGHKEFLKNMVSGAARAEAALLVIDAYEGVKEQSKKHGYLLSLLGIRQVAVVVNKMDLVGYRQDVFRTIEAFNVEPVPTEATAGQSTGITLDEQIFIQRGEIASHEDSAPLVSTTFRCNLFWMGRRPLEASKKYSLRLATREVECEVAAIHRIIDTTDLAAREVKTSVGRNEVAELTIRTKAPITFDLYSDFEVTGRFVLVDQYDVSGGGIVTEAVRDEQTVLREEARRRDIAWVKGDVGAEDRARYFGHRAALVLITGARHTGKSLLARRLEVRLVADGRHTYLLDAANLRRGLDADLSEEDTGEIVRRFGEVARLLMDTGLIVVSTTNALGGADHQAIRTLVHPTPVITVHMSKGDEAPPPDTDLAFAGPKDFEAIADQVMEELKRRGVLAQAIGAKPQFHYSI